MCIINIKPFGELPFIDGKHLQFKKICRAGFENKNSVLTCILDSIKRENDDSEELNISIAGLNSDTKKRTNGLKVN